MPAPDLMPAPTAPIRWNAADRPADTLGYERPGLALAMTRGALGHCPCCGRGRLFSTWLKQEAACGQCGAPIGLVRADDAPPYFVIFIVAHLVIGTQVLTDAADARAVSWLVTAGQGRDDRSDDAARHGAAACDRPVMASP